MRLSRERILIKKRAKSRILKNKCESRRRGQYGKKQGKGRKRKTRINKDNTKNKKSK